MLYVCRQVALDIFCPKMGSWRPFWPAFVRGTCRCDYFFFGLRVDWQQFGKFGGRTGPRSFCVASVRQAIILNLGMIEGLFGAVHGWKDCPEHCNEGSVIKLFVLKLASLKIHSTPQPRRAPYDPIGSFACFLGCTLVGGLVEAVRLVVCLLVFEWARPFWTILVVLEICAMWVLVDC